MGVYIKGMEMPKDCRECKMQVYYSFLGRTWCKSADIILAENYKPIPFDGRPTWCPLVEVSEPHGRLIDVNDVKGRMIPLSYSVEKWIDEVELSNCNTVIEAEGE